MALFYSDNSAKKSAKPTALQTFHIQSLDYQGFGVAKVNGKTWFIENALPNEKVEAKIIEDKRQYGRATAVRFLQKSADRQTPFCSIYSQCGGCQMQHIPLALQRETKQQTLFNRLQKLQAEPIRFEPMLVGQGTNYRRRVKLSMAVQKNTLVVGFRQANTREIIPLNHCDILEPELNTLLPKLQQLFASWKNKKQLGHIELVQADNGVALLLRHIGELHSQDSDKLQRFVEQEDLLLFVMTDKDQISQWRGEVPYYQINGLTLHFSIRDFIQINREMNKQMVNKAIVWLDLQSTDRVLDLFCGMGNFTLPIAPFVEEVVGIEGVEPMVAQAKQNAQTNQINNAKFYQTDLDKPFVDQPWAKAYFNKALLDPARNGAYFALDHLCELQPERIVYVSCNPATLVRDAEKLIAKGYRLSQSAMIDMFPHTAHLESISLFERRTKNRFSN
ncbi:23S rRNA (uracil(1939)-C(5))-methyltransferase RlmD [Glaesserella parasuis]|nr:23S rRNA (uracil(1939)-C(5))-methyltransferase RlmD [Glaesserella parasuis]MDO9996991.1 23S rRNA (uracil(1939)-C(5))-methyltransferase RlmD [Glaesserella parasuis]MDP0013822.1 23S rRNA (uracil(1939)-C(5))-methyltransferase RlmD [Glaesserella parasuis]MDP0045704.1 23S rRNA (uracil(1939)-C(5))-methyltransferase RlmD [Glaesserella parasuis]MDP0137175.1 23S rRNA (uracil(1939)-C(5))-methyltransferase RlmD [Glaesserella parasuis]